VTFSGAPRRQDGIAVITAMLVVTIATVLAVEIAWRTNLDLRRTEGVLTRDQAHQYALGAESFAAQTLQEQLRDQQGQPVYSRTDDEQLCRGLQFTIEGGSMTGGVCDLQGRFNLNNLVDTRARHRQEMLDQFRRLLLAVSELDGTLEIDSSLAESIAQATADWIDPDASAAFNGAEDDAYTGLQPPYRAANFWFTDKTEFRAVRGVTPEIYAAVAPFIAALPVRSGAATLLNVNTAPVPVLMSLGETITRVNAETWVEDSRAEAFQDTTQFTGFAEGSMMEYLGVTSEAFAMRGVVSIGTTELEMYSLLEYTGQAVVPRLRRFGVVESGESYGEPAKVDEEQRQAVADSDE
jgi:general secretion pathway protein K